jgi:hypothetical protein
MIFILGETVIMLLLLIVLVVLVLLGCGGGWYGTHNGWWGGQTRYGNGTPYTNIPFSNGSNTQPAGSGMVEGNPIQNQVPTPYVWNPLHIILVVILVVILIGVLIAFLD